MMREHVFLAVLACLASVCGCQRRPARAQTFLSTVRADLGAVATAVNANPAPSPTASLDEDEPLAPERSTRRVTPEMSPEGWLSTQALAAWSGERDTNRSSIEPETSASDEELDEEDLASTPEDDLDEDAQLAPIGELDEDADAWPDELAGNEIEETAESTSATESDAPEEAKDEPREEVTTATDDDSWRRMAALLGAGSGYTGTGAGELGYTGEGAGEGFTGFGAGTGFTGVTATAPSDASAASNPAQSVDAQAPATFVVVFTPTLFGTWPVAYLQY